MCQFSLSLSLSGFARPRCIIDCQITILSNCIRVDTFVSDISPRSWYIESPKAMKFHTCNHHFVMWWRKLWKFHTCRRLSHAAWWRNQVKRALVWVYEKKTLSILKFCLSVIGSRPTYTVHMGWGRLLYLRLHNKLKAQK